MSIIQKERRKTKIFIDIVNIFIRCYSEQSEESLKSKWKRSFADAQDDTAVPKMTPQ